jgi:hypothetical protein
MKFAAFCLFVRALPIDFALLGGETEIHESKTTENEERKEHRLQCMVRDILGTFGHLPDTLSFSLPLNFIANWRLC